MTNAYDGHVGTDHDLTLAVADYLYVGNGNKFNIINVDVGTANDISSVMTGAYWNGSVWTAVTITDNTKSGSDTLKQDGTIKHITGFIDLYGNKIYPIGAHAECMNLDKNVTLTMLNEGGN